LKRRGAISARPMPSGTTPQAISGFRRGTQTACQQEAEEQKLLTNGVLGAQAEATRTLFGQVCLSQHASWENPSRKHCS
jgi:hypothetical protein